MILIQEIINDSHAALIYKREDGLYEGRLYPAEVTRCVSTHALHRTGCDFYVCGVADTLPNVSAVVHQELGLNAA